MGGGHEGEIQASYRIDSLEIVLIPKFQSITASYRIDS